MESFLDPRLKDEITGMYKSLARLQETTPAELTLRQGAIVSIYDCHPWLFYEAFPAARLEDVRTLNLAVRLFASSLMAATALSSLTSSADRSLTAMRQRTWQYQGCHCLHQLFPADAAFWGKLCRVLLAAARAADEQQRFITGDGDWTTYRDFAYEIATGENGIGQISIFGLVELSQNSAPADALLSSLNDVSFAVRMLADLRCWRQQLRNGIPSLLLSQVIDQAPSLDNPDAISLLTQKVEKRMLRTSSASHMLLEALRALDRAEESLRSLPSLVWRRVIEMYRRSCLTELESKTKIIPAACNGTPAVVLDQARTGKSIPGFAWKGLQMLLREWNEGLPEATHVMTFPRSQGFNNPTEDHAGDVFQRALLLDVFCDANEKLDHQLSTVVAEEAQTLLDRRRTTGVGGWSYFPHLRELPADTDDLAQVMLGFLRSGRNNAVSKYCERPLSVLLSDNGNPDGSFETWIIPKDRDEELALQAHWVQSAWGSGADCEVNANLLYALWIYDRIRFSEILARGTRYILDCQQPDGSWKGTWYHGPFYATWMCLRLLKSTCPDTHAISKGQEFLASRQNADGSWDDPLSTSFALLGLATSKNGRTPQNEMIAAALQWLQQTQASDGGWEATPFIKMELGRPTGRPWETLTYQSRTVSTLAAVKAALAWSE